jgi:hypothetical protein
MELSAKEKLYVEAKIKKKTYIRCQHHAQHFSKLKVLTSWRKLQD